MSSEFDADVIVIGAGILGGAVAHSLARQRKSVIVLEAGPELRRADLVRAFRNYGDKSDYNGPYPDQPWAPKSSTGRYSDHYIDSVGPILQKPSYLRLVGGTTWHWGGATWRMLPNDFRLRSLYGQGRDWPLDYDELEPWYQLAEEEIGVSGSDTDDQSGRGGGPFPPRSKPYPMKQQPWAYLTQEVATRVAAIGHRFVDEPNARATRPYDGRPVCAGNNNCAPICPIGAQFSGDRPVHRAVALGARLLANAVAHKIERGANGRIAAVHYMTPDGHSTRLTARAFVLAAHGVEIPKLLLMSGIANSSDQVGRNMMGHTGRALAMLTSVPLWPGRGPTQQGSINTWRDGAFRREHGAIRHFLDNTVPNERITRRLIDQGIVGPELDARIRADAARYLKIASYVEPLPDPANRVTLSTHRDALGLPTPRTDYDMRDYARRALPRLLADYSAFRRAFGATDMLGDVNAWVPSSHIMGTTIMGRNPKDSVVDRDCRTHDHPNLFIASTAVHPSASVVNPTLTGYALALRLAARIGAEV
ncbi:choline dehydrogenase [Burkholderia stabilis]|uniref:GMC family oxidoreductase n=1 Tax=Burkholderia stabilis TaxID=95485 RepID=UPI0008517216|nr:GMC family oxidoreductase [Burkholderia stabilis]AOR70238.1 choline dehydrogenase [Burkholderia stabilis]HDR9489417.1 GMC family oxidoreductase [Burkholderia stabilis]HDR9527020.1 GMC family oxidoreductase [Burkholderia stabilis]HDR9534352.1 GMC family oxidoreductase [Burkholderia stabilis]HDR9535575.1 GMC family oxidoreductase [Burkholderia stabilis]